MGQVEQEVEQRVVAKGTGLGNGNIKQDREGVFGYGALFLASGFKAHANRLTLLDDLWKKQWCILRNKRSKNHCDRL